MRENYAFLTDEQKRYILQEYAKCEKTYREIGFDIGLKETSVSDFIRRKIRKGELQRINRKGIITRRSTEYNQFKKAIQPDVINHKADPNVDVNCNKVHNQCIFGCRGNSGKCNFLACMNKARITTSPDPKHCHDFVKISKDHPRLTKGVNDF